jgi:hypothetical protein
MIAHGLPIYVALDPVDMRLGYERLGGVVREKMRTEPRSRALFVFVGKRGHTMKMLTWDGTGAICRRERHPPRAQGPPRYAAHRHSGVARGAPRSHARGVHRDAYCQGPAVVSLPSGTSGVIVFVLAMLAGMFAARQLETANRQPDEPAATPAPQRRTGALRQQLHDIKRARFVDCHPARRRASSPDYAVYALLCRAQGSTLRACRCCTVARCRRV